MSQEQVMIKSETFWAFRVITFLFLPALFVGWFAVDMAHGQAVDRNEESLERNRQTLHEMEVLRFINTLNMLHGTHKLAVELDRSQVQQLAELAKSVVQQYFRSDDFRLGLREVGDRAGYRKVFGNVIQEDDLNLQRTQIEQFRTWKDQFQNLLLPHQLELLKFGEVREAAMMKNREFDSLGVALGLSDELNLDEEQRKLLKEDTEKAVQQYRAEAANLNKKAWTEVLAALPEEKRKKLAELVGDLATETQFDVSKR
jgi:hypothetical protein